MDSSNLADMRGLSATWPDKTARMDPASRSGPSATACSNSRRSEMSRTNSVKSRRSPSRTFMEFGSHPVNG